MSTNIIFKLNKDGVTPVMQGKYINIYRSY